MVKAERSMSEAGRAAMAAGGRATIAVNRVAGEEAARALKVEMAETEAALRSQLLNPLTGAQRVLLRTALASYEAVYRIEAGLLTARNSRRVAELISQLTPAAGTLMRAVRALNLSPKDGDDPDAQSGSALASYLAGKSSTEGRNGDG